MVYIIAELHFNSRDIRIIALQGVSAVLKA